MGKWIILLLILNHISPVCNMLSDQDLSCYWFLYAFEKTMDFWSFIPSLGIKKDAVYSQFQQRKVR